jgi:hypothetical protein
MQRFLSALASFSGALERLADTGLIALGNCSIADSIRQLPKPHSAIAQEIAWSPRMLLKPLT